MRTAIISILLMLSAPASPAAADMVCTLIADAGTGVLLMEEGDCRSRVTPASTFKIPLAAMAYEAGILTDAHHPVMAFRDGDPDWGDNWKRDTDPAGWMRHSVLWYSQRIAHALGAGTLSRHARDFGYGNADFSGDPGFDNGLERAWIASSLQVSPLEQAGFLRALVTGTLPVSASAMAHTREIVESRDRGGWTIHGKTGAAYPRRQDRSFDHARGWGWYVGWAEQGGRVLIFVSLTQARERSAASPGNLTRDAFLGDWPALVQRLGP